MRIFGMRLLRIMIAHVVASSIYAITWAFTRAIVAAVLGNA
jgi:hypothetical protein